MFNKIQSVKYFFILAGPFLGLSLASFMSPYLVSMGSYPISDFLLASLWFFIVCSVQLSLLILLKKYFHNNIVILIGLLFLLGNLYFFTFLISSWSKWDFIAYVFLYIILYIIGFVFNKGLIIIYVFLAAQFVIPLVAYTLNSNLLNINEIRVLNEVKKNPNQNIYIIGIDTIVSKEALSKIFLVENSPAYQWLEDNNFKLYDLNSPGDQTLTTFASLIKGDANVHPRTVRGYFNGTKPSQLYSYLESIGYKRQFFYDNDYFGVGPGRIEDFKPLGHSWNLCKFIDHRWGYYVCKFFNYGRLDDSSKNQEVDKLIQYYLKNVKINDNEKWFSISYIWHPGHSIGDYDGADLTKRENYISYYKKSQEDIKKIFNDITLGIKSRDKNPIIVFMGDHGAYALRSSKKLDENLESLKQLDARSVLWAVYPEEFCQKEISKTVDTSKLLITIAECSVK
jgi:hypothetical protein